MGDERLMIAGELLYVAWFVMFFGAFGAIGFVVTQIPWVRRRLDAANDRNIGPDQLPLWRQARRTGVVPPGADVDRWREFMGKKNTALTVHWIVGSGVVVAFAFRTLTAPPRSGSEVIAHAILPLAFLILVAWNVTYLRRERRLRRQLFQA